jgi:hypothetical protein
LSTILNSSIGLPRRVLGEASNVKEQACSQ